MRAAWVVVALVLLAMSPLPASGAGADASCSPGGPAVTNSNGAGDPLLPSLVYASLKTGFRAMVVWTTEQPEVGRLRYSVDGGTPIIRTETVPRTVHVFVVDGLAIGRAFCFTPLHADNSPATATQHAMRTGNAMNAHDGTAYTLNLAVLMNEQPDVRAVEYAMDAFAERLYDATEGHVRAGRIILLAGDLEHHNAGWLPCAAFSTPGCAARYDVLFTADATPQGAASTFLDAIHSNTQAIYMNWYHQAGLVNLGDDVGSVLMHEVGHYAFGAIDLYGGTDNCWDETKSLSIMGAAREATEFDDEINRCPDEASIAGYSPSYPRLRQRFPLVPDRAGVIDAGPFGDGGRYARVTFEVAPQASNALGVPDLPEVEQDDAGSGGDAGAFTSTAVPIEPDVLYEGRLLSPIDGADLYRFEAPAGSSVALAVYPRATSCFRVLAEDGSTYASSCTHDPLSTRMTIEADGEPLYLRIALGTSPSYRFGFGVDGPAPSPV